MSETSSCTSVDYNAGIKPDGDSLDILKVFTYNIPSFSVISLRVIINDYGRDTDADALDIFLREDPRFDSLDIPTTIVVFEGCLVNCFS